MTERRYFKHKIMGHVKELHDLDLEQFVASDLWEPISEEEFLNERIHLFPGAQTKMWEKGAATISLVPTRVENWGPDFSVTTLQMVIQISVAKLYEVEVAAAVASRAVDISRIFGVKDIAELWACTKMVMIGAKTGDAGDDWAAYTAPNDTIQLMNVTQVDESTLIRRTFQMGDKLHQSTAEALFPIFVQMGFKYRH